MSIKSELLTRSNSKCELCGATNDLVTYEVAPITNDNADEHILVCNTCFEQMDNPEKVEPNHWRCLNDSMWSEVPAVQVIAWRMLTRLRNEGWPADLLEMLYLDEETLAWAKATGEGESEDDIAKHKDSNGVILQSGDTVVITKDLDVKGSSITAKRGTAVRNITLVHDNVQQIEGKVNGQQIVILTKFVKKSN